MENKQIAEIHEEVYNLLNHIRENENHLLTFTLRKSNRDAKLEQGYWFYGNDIYLAVSFWSGNDWKNRTPNIIFVITANGKTFLEITTSDSKIKREFIEKYLVEEIYDIRQSGLKFHKEYHFNDYSQSLRKFLQEDKLIIDRAINLHQSFFSLTNNSDKEDRIAFITEDDFRKTQKKVEAYRNENREEDFPEENKSLKSIIINNYGGINNQICIENIPEDTQWIFVTGENGSGKTSILRAMTTALINRPLTKKEVLENPNFYVEFNLYKWGKEKSSNNTTKVVRNANSTGNRQKLWIKGFAAYGASRLITNHSGLSSVDLVKFQKKAGLAYSIYNTDGLLIDLLYKVQNWKRNKVHQKLTDDRLENIKTILYEIIPNLHKVIFDEYKNKSITLYIEEDINGNPFTEQYNTFDKLASGIRSMVAMLGDMMCRLFDQQPYKSDPSELTGIVIIDEIDIHLHPKLQRKLVEELSRTFKQVQFIVSTHSPIPLLGAPSNSIFLNVYRDPAKGVCAEKLDIDITSLLPNTILTSPIFDFDFITSNGYNETKRLRTEQDYDEALFYQILEQKIKDKSLRHQ